jgi:hypothetical protein
MPRAQAEGANRADSLSLTLANFDREHRGREIHNIEWLSAIPYAEKSN